MNENVQVVAAPGGRLDELEIAPVQAALNTALPRRVSNRGIDGSET
jgi:hypothetical protein